MALTMGGYFSVGGLQKLVDNLIWALEKTLEVSVDAGDATGGSATTVVDDTKEWGEDIWKNALCEVTDDSGVGYIRFVESNTSDTLVLKDSLPIDVEAGFSYQLKLPINVQDIERWGNEKLTGRDITQDLEKLQNVDVKISELKQAINEELGKIIDNTQYIYHLQNLDVELSKLKQEVKEELGKVISNTEDVEKLQNMDIKLSQMKQGINTEIGKVIDNTQYVHLLQSVDVKISDLKQAINEEVGKVVSNTEDIDKLQNLDMKLSETKQGINTEIGKVVSNTEDVDKLQNLDMKLSEAKQGINTEIGKVVQNTDLVKNLEKVLVTSGLIEYYFNSGALFEATPAELVTAAPEQMLQWELASGDDYTCRLFEYFVSTLANKFQLVVYEVPARDLEDSELEDYQKSVITKVNRVKKKGFPLGAYHLTPEGDAYYDFVAFDETAEYEEGDLVIGADGNLYICTVDMAEAGTEYKPPVGGSWEDHFELYGEIVYNRHYLQGMSFDRSSLSELNNKEYNYIFVISNKDGSERDFGLSLAVGINEFLEHFE